LTTAAPETTSDSSVAEDSPESELTPGTEGQRLTLSRFFNPESSWQEDRFTIAGEKNVVGIAAQVAGCSSAYAQELELRLGNNFSSLTFSVGQADSSDDSDQNLSVEVEANNAQVEIRSVPFNEVQEFDIPVTSVNALKIRMYLDDAVENCGGSVVGVIMDPVVN
jgi:hypothetical protein